MKVVALLSLIVIFTSLLLGVIAYSTSEADLSGGASILFFSSLLLVVILTCLSWGIFRGNLGNLVVVSFTSILGVLCVMYYVVVGYAMSTRDVDIAVEFVTAMSPVAVISLSFIALWAPALIFILRSKNRINNKPTIG